MGMDVYGKSPDCKTGEYFRRNVWGWHPLAEYCLHAAPELVEKIQHLHSNDGDGLGKRDSQKLAVILRQEIESGSFQRYADARNARLNALPDQTCEYCKGTGKRTDMEVPNGCNACDGKGKIRPFITSYDVDLNDVKEFADFLEHCGGFEIF